MKIKGLEEAYACLDEIVPSVTSLYVWYNTDEDAIESCIVMRGNWISLPEHNIHIGEFARKLTFDGFSGHVEFVLSMCNREG